MNWGNLLITFDKVADNDNYSVCVTTMGEFGGAGTLGWPVVARYHDKTADGFKIDLISLHATGGTDNNAPGLRDAEFSFVATQILSEKYFRGNWNSEGGFGIILASPVVPDDEKTETKETKMKRKSPKSILRAAARLVRKGWTTQHSGDNGSRAGSRMVYERRRQFFVLGRADAGFGAYPPERPAGIQ